MSTIYGGGSYDLNFDWSSIPRWDFISNWCGSELSISLLQAVDAYLIVLMDFSYPWIYISTTRAITLVSVYHVTVCTLEAFRDLFIKGNGDMETWASICVIPQTLSLDFYARLSISYRKLIRVSIVSFYPECICVKLTVSYQGSMRVMSMIPHRYFYSIVMSAICISAWFGH